MVMDAKFKVLDLHNPFQYKDYVRAITEVGTSTCLVSTCLGDEVTTLRSEEDALYTYLIGYIMNRFRDIKNDQGELIWM